MEVKRRDFLKSGVATLGAASLGAMAAGVVGEKGVAEAAAEPEYKLFALKYAGPFTSSVAMVFFNKEWDKTIARNYYIWAVQGGGRRWSSMRECVRLWPRRENLEDMFHPIKPLLGSA